MAVQNPRLVHTSIDAPPERVYAFAADPQNLPRWAVNFGTSLSRSGAEWVMETAAGPVRVRFAPPNALGVLDHWVYPPGGGEIYNAVRVTANGAGSVVSFVLCRQEGWSDEDLARDAGLVADDLARLKELVESAGTHPATTKTGETPMQPRLDLIGIVVSDMARSLAFYRQLGLHLPPEADGEPHVETTLPGGLRLAWDTEEVLRSFDPSWTAPTGGHRLGLAFLCGTPAEVDAAYERLVGLGYHGHKAPWDAFWGQRYAVVHDPDGNPVDLFAPNG